MYIYLDESYNLQKNKGKMFISISGFAILNDQKIRKDWKIIRKKYTKFNRRIHSTDTHFKKLRKKSIKLLEKHDLNILSVFQLTQKLPFNYFSDKIKFDSVYANLLKKLFLKISIEESKKITIIIDSRKHKGGILAEKKFKKEIELFLKLHFSNTKYIYKPTPSYFDVLIELADFISNTFYKEYINNLNHTFKNTKFKLIQIKNPL